MSRNLGSVSLLFVTKNWTLTHKTKGKFHIKLRFFPVEDFFSILRLIHLLRQKKGTKKDCTLGVGSCVFVCLVDTKMFSEHSLCFRNFFIVLVQKITANYKITHISESKNSIFVDSLDFSGWQLEPKED